MTVDWDVVIFKYVCPSLAVLLSNALFAAPINDVRRALQRGSLGSLNPTPWAVMSGNCVGWCVYAYYARDPFILASNIPGVLVSVWLNSAATKLLYYSEIESSNEITEIGESAGGERVLSNEGDQTGSAAVTTTAAAEATRIPSSIRKESLVFTSQDALWLQMLSLWMIVLVGVGWLGLVHGREKETIGILCNINVLFFYGAPLQNIKIVVEDKCSDSIHTPTMILSCVNAGFWGAYGVAVNSPVIYVPNGIGLLLGLIQAVLCCIFPKNRSVPVDVDATPLLMLMMLTHRNQG